MKEFYADFILMQAELPSVMKSKQGQAGQGKFKYADLTEIVDTIRPILSKHGFAFMQTIETIEGSTYLVTLLMHKAGNGLSAKTVIDYAGDDIKKFGAAITYYRRYTLQSMLGIVADADPDDVPETIKKDDADSKKLDQFIKAHGLDYGGKNVNDYLGARCGHNLLTVSQNISELNLKPDLFHKEIKNWLEKNNR